MGSDEAIEKFAEAHDLAFQRHAKLPLQGETLEAAERAEIGAGASGELPGGIEGTLAHFDYTTTNDGTTYQTRSTMKSAEYAPDVDATNHPFYTGKRQFLDTAGRVEKFMRRYGKK